MVTINTLQPEYYEKEYTNIILFWIASHNENGYAYIIKKGGNVFHSATMSK